MTVARFRPFPAEKPNMKFFDSLTHPTLNGAWYGGRSTLNPSSYRDYLTSFPNLMGAFACGLIGIGAYDQKQFIRQFTMDSPVKVRPIIPVDLGSKYLSEDISSAVKLGVNYFKIHPNTIESKMLKLSKAFEIITYHQKIIFLCTYVFGNRFGLTSDQLFRWLTLILSTSPETRL